MLDPVLLVALLGGLLPALLWLAFWLMEDRCEPEPKRFIFFCFILGMAAIPLVLWGEKLVANYLTGPLLLLAWAIIEEFAKFGAAYFAALRWSVFDEPLDAVIYLITAALGFAALENTLFILSPLESGNLLQTILTGNLRFVGATLLHTLSSATVGLALAFAFYHRASIRRLAAIGGLILATLLHTLFNLSILGKGGSSIFWIFLLIWLGIVGALLLVERVKQPSRDYC
ncbi:MAG: PrsW family glutamic-type intramembrane protease [Candidatus Adlerbacteria bacterium]|nr:PrsW family glutamic-type intramembrane protease [Candidatus Adlerbacteria bacterium]